MDGGGLPCCGCSEQQPLPGKSVAAGARALGASPAQQGPAPSTHLQRLVQAPRLGLAQAVPAHQRLGRQVAAEDGGLADAQGGVVCRRRWRCSCCRRQTLTLACCCRPDVTLRRCCCWDGLLSGIASAGPAAACVAGLGSSLGGAEAGVLRGSRDGRAPAGQAIKVVVRLRCAGGGKQVFPHLCRNRVAGAGQVVDC